MSGAEIKQLILNSGLKLWQVAARWGVNDGNFSRRLRRPFDKNEVEQVRQIISDLRKEQEDTENG